MRESEKETRCPESIFFAYHKKIYIRTDMTGLHRKRITNTDTRNPRKKRNIFGEEKRKIALFI